MMQHYYERDGVRLSYYLDDYTDPWTQAPTLLLLLHGAMANAQRFYSWVPGLSRDTAWCAPTCAGMGCPTCRRRTSPWTCRC